MRLDIVSWCALIFLGGTCLVSGSSTGARSSTDSGSSLEKSIGSWKRDPFVHEAPLILAASCQDGVVVLAAHTRDDQEPLLYKALDQQGDAKDDGSFTDLPRNYQGPFRINTVDQYGTVLVSTGWRADCDAFLRNAKALAQKESMQFGPPPSTALSSGYGDLLARRLSLYLAQCAVSERVRASWKSRVIKIHGNGHTGAWSLFAHNLLFPIMSVPSFRRPGESLELCVFVGTAGQ